MVEFNDPFQITSTPDLCDNNICPIIVTPICLVCGYPDDALNNCLNQETPCLDGSIECLNCELAFDGLNTEFLGGFVSGFSSRLGFGASESLVNIDIVIPKNKCSSTISTPTTCFEECTEYTYEGKLGYIFTFNMGSFCFRGILTNHSYVEDSSGYKYRVTLTDGRNILNSKPILVNSGYIKLPKEFKNDIINVSEQESSVIENDCGNGYQCQDFMSTGGGSNKGAKIKSILEAINNKCISIPVSEAGLKINVTKLINVISDDLRTSNTEFTIIELLVLATEESGYDFLVFINNNNEFEILPVNYKRPATEKSLFQFISDLSAKDIVISKEYGEEMSGISSKNKRVVIGDNISYLTSVRDFPLQRYARPEQTDISLSAGICCYVNNDGDMTCIESTRASCENLPESVGSSSKWYPNSSCFEESCYMQPPCTIKNNPASIGAYDTFFITPTPYPEEC